MNKTIRNSLKQQFLKFEHDYSNNNNSVQDFVIKFRFKSTSYFLIRRSNTNSLTKLSPREYEIALHISKGLSNKIIAKKLDLSVYTVTSYIRRIFIKLEVNNRTELVNVILNKTKLKLL